MDWRYNQTWVMAPLVVGTFIETVEVIGVPVPVNPFMMRQPPPTVIVEESHYQFATQGVVPHPDVTPRSAAPHPGVTPQPSDEPHRAEPNIGAARPAAAPEAGKPAKAVPVDPFVMQQQQQPLLPTPAVVVQPLLPTPAVMVQQEQKQPLLPTPAVMVQQEQKQKQPLLPTPAVMVRQEQKQPLLPTPAVMVQQEQKQPLLPTPAVMVQQSHYQFMAQRVVPHLATPIPAVPKPDALKPDTRPAEGTCEKTGIVEECMELSTWNAAQLSTKVSDILTGCSTNQWHQIIVRPAIPENERHQVISAINKSISPLKIIPYFFSMESLPYKFGSKFISFFVNSSLALKALCERNLEVPYDSDNGYKIGLVLRLCNKNFNLPDALKQIVLRRLDSEKKFLDLSYINDIPEIQVLLYDPNDNVHILDHMLWIARGAVSTLTALSLAGNGITITVLLKLAFFLSHSRWNSLRTLDLSDNKHSSLEDVQ